MLINENNLRRLIREELIRRINETKAITRKASGEERRVEEFRRKPVEAIEDVRFLSREDARPGSPFVATGKPGDAYSKTYNAGQETFRVMLTRKLAGGREEKFSIPVEAPPIKEDDIVVIPELLSKTKMGAGVVTSVDRLDAAKFGGKPGEGIPIATVKFDSNATPGGVPVSYTNIGWAFLVRIGSFKTESGRSKMAEENSKFSRALRGDAPRSDSAPSEEEDDS